MAAILRHAAPGLYPLLAEIRAGALSRPPFRSPLADRPALVASLWEVAIKRGLERDDFRADPRLLRRGLLNNGYQELAISGEHAAAVDALPPHHKNPFDRIFIAQSIVEGITLMTTDPLLTRYPAVVRHL